MYTVKQLSELAGVSVRTLHYYHEIGLLSPTRVGGNGYRYYDDAALLRLQQIMFYRELGLELLQIRTVLDDPDFDVLTALRFHRVALETQRERLKNLIDTVDATILHLAGEHDMSKKQLFAGFSPEQQKEYEREARLQYGPEHVNESVRRWNGYTQAQKDAIMAEGGTIYSDLAAALVSGTPPQDEAVQAILTRWHRHIEHFYTPTLDILRGLGELYHSDPAFIANFQQFHADLPDYLHAGITHYVDEQETAEIIRLLEADEGQHTTDA